MAPPEKKQGQDAYSILTVIVVSPLNVNDTYHQRKQPFSVPEHVPKLILPFCEYQWRIQHFVDEAFYHPAPRRMLIPLRFQLCQLGFSLLEPEIVF